MRWAAILLAATVVLAEDETGVRLWVNGAVHTMDDARPRAEALAVRDGRIVAVGSTAELTREYGGAGGRTTDLGGACVVPGLIDAHGHLAALASLKRQLDLRAVRSYGELVERVKAHAAKLPKGAWVLGGRWDQAAWGRKDLPSHRPLSAATPDHPVLLSRVDGHAALANRVALALAGVTRDTPDPEGGEILKDEWGDPTGLLVDNAVDLVRRVVPEGGGAPAGDLWREAQEACFRAGLTGVHDAGVPVGAVEDLRARYGRGELKLRVHGMLADFPGIEGWLAENAPRPDDRFAVRAVKLYIDGAMGSRGAWMLEEYSDRPRHTGLNVMPVARLRKICEVAARNGWQVCTHAIGDRGNREVLDAYNAAITKHPGDHRFRVEHAQCLHRDDVPRFRALRVIASMQPTHATSDMRWAEDRVGPDRLEGCYAWRRLLDAGTRLCFGSDFPVESEKPLWGIYAAVTRRDHEGRPEGGWMPDQRVTAAEALRLFTRDAAYAAFLEDRLGSLERGKLADFVVLDRDPLAVEPHEILSIRVLRTVVEGETVYAAP